MKKRAIQLEQNAVGERAPAGILDSMKGREFILSVKRAGMKAADAVEALDEMTMWAKRLKPYFDFDPEMTVAQALQLYLNEHSKKAPRCAEGS